MTPETFFKKAIPILLFVLQCVITNAQYPGYSKYVRAMREKETIRKNIFENIYAESPLYVGIPNKIRITAFNTDGLLVQTGIGLTEDFINGEYTINCIAPGDLTIYLRRKADSCAAYAVHYIVKRLPGDELKEEPVISIGDNTGNQISLDVLKKQKDIKVSKGFIFKSGVVYFAGTGFPNVYVVSVAGTWNSYLEAAFSKCMAGSQIVFDNVRVADEKGKEYTIVAGSFTVTN